MPLIRLRSLATGAHAAYERSGPALCTVSMSLRAQFLQDDWAQRADNDLLMENVGAVGEGARICQLVRAFITLDHLRLAGCTERCASSCVMN